MAPGARRAHRLLPLLAPQPFSHRRALLLSVFSRVSIERQHRLSSPHLPCISLSIVPAIHHRHLPLLPPSPFPPPSTIEPLSPSSVAAVAVLFSSHFLTSVATPSPVFSSSLPLAVATTTVPTADASPPHPRLSFAFIADYPSQLPRRHLPLCRHDPDDRRPFSSAPLRTFLLPVAERHRTDADLPLLPRLPCHYRFLSFVLPSPTTALTTIAASLPPSSFRLLHSLHPATVSLSFSTVVAAAAVLRRREPPLPASPPSQSPTPASSTVKPFSFPCVRLDEDG